MTDLVQSAELAKADGGIYSLIRRQAPEIQKVLGSQVSTERFARIVVTTLRNTPGLAECSEASILGGIMQSAQLGLDLEPARGHAYLVPFKDRSGRKHAQFIIGYRGFIELAYRSSKLRDIQAHEVMDNDVFSYEFGTSQKIKHVPALKDRGELVAAYAVARLRDGGVVMNVLSADEVNARRNRSRAKDAGPWVSDYLAMVRKSAVRSLAPYLPSSVFPEEDERVVSWNGTTIEAEAVDDTDS